MYNTIKTIMVSMIMLSSSLIFQNVNADQGQKTKKCGTVSLAEMNWLSATLLANVDKLILEEGFGCTVIMQSGGTDTIFVSMNEKMKPDIAPEMWTHSFGEPYKKALAEQRLLEINTAPLIEGGEGWWITPKTLEKHPELTSIEEVIKRPDLFPDKENPEKGAFVGCPAGWGCEKVNLSLFEAYDMAEKGWKVVNPGSGSGLKISMSKAAERGENWFGYYWQPTALIDRHKMVKLKSTDYAGDENWHCINQFPENRDESCKTLKPTAWLAAKVSTLITGEAQAKLPQPVIEYFKKRSFSNESISSMLLSMDEEQTDGEDAAFQYLEKFQDEWTAWLDPKIADKVMKAIQ